MEENIRKKVLEGLPPEIPISEIPKKPSKRWLKITLFSILGLILASGLVFAGFFAGLRFERNRLLPLMPLDCPPQAPISISDETVNWNTYTNTEHGYSIKYPSNWVLDGTVFDDENGDKIAEFSPGQITPKEEISCAEVFRRALYEGSDIEAPETNISFFGEFSSKLIKQEEVEIKGVRWDLMITETPYEGGYPEWTGIWYPHEYCTRKANRLFLINFYEEELPSQNRELFELMLSTFRFLEAEEWCVKAETGEKIGFLEAKEIALESECVKKGNLRDEHFCNQATGTWWVDLDIQKEGCAPTCVIDIATRKAKINWRCTGLNIP